MSSSFSKEETIFYSRQILLDEIEFAGQQKLKSAKVLIIGAGGLGSPAALYLAAAGIGTLGILDSDTVEISNLHRQILHAHMRAGQLKTDSAAQTLKGLNPHIKAQTYPVRLTAEKAETVFKNYDVIVDGSDNFPTRYIVNDVCCELKKPFVHGSVLRFEGQVSVFWPGRGPCYRCLYPEPPPPEACASCSEAGVLGALPGIIGTLQAMEAIKLILEKGDILLGRLLCYNALKGQFKELRFQKDPRCDCRLSLI